MTAKTFEIQVQDDHLQRISQVRKPILAVAELIRNAVDADADRIDVVLHDDNLGGLKAIEVADNGHGCRTPMPKTCSRALAAHGSKAGIARMRSVASCTAKKGVGAFALSPLVASLIGTSAMPQPPD